MPPSSPARPADPIVLRSGLVIPLLLVACLSFGAGAYLFGGRVQGSGDLGAKPIAGEFIDEKSGGDLLALPAVAPPATSSTGSREIVAADSPGPKTASAQEQVPGLPLRKLAGLYGELDALDQRGGIHESKRRVFLDELIRGLTKERDGAGALQVLDLYGEGILLDYQRYTSLAFDMERQGLTEVCLALNQRLCNAWSDIVRPLRQMRRLSPQAALDSLKANFERMDEGQKAELRVCEAQLLADLGRTAEGLELMKEVLAAGEPTQEALWALNALAPLEARKLIAGLYEEDAEYWAPEYVEHLETAGDVEGALDVLRETMAGQPYREELFEPLMRLAPLEAHGFLVAQGSPAAGDEDSSYAWEHAGNDLEQLGLMPQAVDMWLGALASRPGLDFPCFYDLLEHAPIALAEAMEAKAGETKHVGTLLDVAEAYWHAGRIEEAKLALETCLEYGDSWQYYTALIKSLDAGEEPQFW